MRKPQDRITLRETKGPMWKEIRKLKVFTVDDLLGICTLKRDTIQAYLNTLVMAEEPRLSREEISDPKDASGAFQTRFRYTLIWDSIDPPRIGPDGKEIEETGRQRMWDVMRARKASGFTVADVRALASRPGHPIAVEEAKTFMRYLEHAAYIRNMNGKPQARAFFRLIRDTGTLSPWSRGSIRYGTRT